VKLDYDVRGLPASLRDWNDVLDLPSAQLPNLTICPEGVSEVAPEEPALKNFHQRVHLGEPGEYLTIVRIPVGGECPPDPIRRRFCS
jgi:hypothetical protein